MSDPLDANLQRLKEVCRKDQAGIARPAAALDLSTDVEPDDSGGLTALLRRWAPWSRQQRGP